MKRLSFKIIFIVIFILISFFIFLKLKHKHAAQSRFGADDLYSIEYKQSGHGQIKIEKWKIDIPETAYSTGPFFQIDEANFLVANRTGDIYLVSLDGKKASSRIIKKIDLGPKNPKRIVNDLDIDDSGVKDIKIYDGKVYVSATKYSPERNCYSLVLYFGNFANHTINQLNHFWESKPECIAGSPSIAGELGGKILILSREKLLIGVGGGAVDTLVIDSKSDYGKVLQINHLDARITQINTFTRGHRNPSGLFWDDKNKRILETEHGPSGGDELNILIKGENYGWPHVTYGYESHESNFYMIEKSEFNHNGYAAPFFSFIPSIGISGVAVMKSNNQFPMWSGDVFVGSLTGTNYSGLGIFRIHSTKNSPNLVEKIEIGERVRALNIMPDGSLYFKTDSQHIGKVSRVAR